MWMPIDTFCPNTPTGRVGGETPRWHRSPSRMMPAAAAQTLLRNKTWRTLPGLKTLQFNACLSYMGVELENSDPGAAVCMTGTTLSGSLFGWVLWVIEHPQEDSGFSIRTYFSPDQYHTCHLSVALLSGLIVVRLHSFSLCCAWRSIPKTADVMGMCEDVTCASTWRLMTECPAVVQQMFSTEHLQFCHFLEASQTHISI